MCFYDHVSASMHEKWRCMHERDWWLHELTMSTPRCSSTGCLLFSWPPPPALPLPCWILCWISISRSKTATGFRGAASSLPINYGCASLLPRILSTCSPAGFTMEAHTPSISGSSPLMERRKKVMTRGQFQQWNCMLEAVIWRERRRKMEKYIGRFCLCDDSHHNSSPYPHGHFTSSSGSRVADRHQRCFHVVATGRAFVFEEVFFVGWQLIPYYLWININSNIAKMTLWPNG